MHRSFRHGVHAGSGSCSGYNNGRFSECKFGVFGDTGGGDIGDNHRQRATAICHDCDIFVVRCGIFAQRCSRHVRESSDRNAAAGQSRGLSVRNSVTVVGTQQFGRRLCIVHGR